mmetsp:Transcript_16865/g.41767  ORF Transcript_16865/g.41767 Transcript_16865/m.41767 type:complete len:288 (-) Transcript_16865:700-1563(-)
MRRLLAVEREEGREIHAVFVGKHEGERATGDLLEFLGKLEQLIFGFAVVVVKESHVILLLFLLVGVRVLSFGFCAPRHVFGYALCKFESADIGADGIVPQVAQVLVDYNSSLRFEGRGGLLAGQGRDVVDVFRLPPCFPQFFPAPIHFPQVFHRDISHVPLIVRVPLFHYLQKFSFVPNAHKFLLRHLHLQRSFYSQHHVSGGHVPLGFHLLVDLPHLFGQPVVRRPLGFPGLFRRVEHRVVDSAVGPYGVRATAFLPRLLPLHVIEQRSGVDDVLPGGFPLVLRFP